MANGLMTGNVIVDPSTYDGQYTSPIPGYRFYRAAGYVALKGDADNKFPVWVPSQQKGLPRQKLSIPRGAQVYHVGMRFGHGVWSEGAQDITLAQVDQGVVNPAAAVHIDRVGNSVVGTATGKPWAIVGTAASLEKASRTTLLRSARTAPNPFNPARLDAFNQPIATQGLGGYEDGFDITAAASNRSVQLELQCRTGPLPADPLQAVGPAIGGLRFNSDPLYVNQGYILIQVGYYTISEDVVTADDFAGVVWEEVFANV
jgi:hypothetical protein